MPFGLYGALSNLLVSGEAVERNNGVNYYEADGPFSTLLNGWGQTEALVPRSGELVSVTVGPWERIRKHAGLEVSVLDILSVRLGRYHRSDGSGGRQYTAVGIGVDAYFVALDASWALGEAKRSRMGDRFREYSYGRLTVRIPLSDSPRNFCPALLEGEK